MHPGTGSPSGVVHETAEAARIDREQLITTHLAFARHLAARFAQRGQPKEDLEQVAYLGLVKASDRFDPARGLAFSTYAGHVIVGELRHHLRDGTWAVHAPRSLRQLYFEVSAATGELTQSLARSPTIREIAQACGRDEAEVLEALEVGQGMRTFELDAGADATRRGVVTGPSGDEANPVDTRSELEAHLALLSDEDRTLLHLRFEDELSQSEIAERLGTNQVQVSRQLRRALQALRKSYRDHA